MRRSERLSRSGRRWVPGVPRHTACTAAATSTHLPSSIVGGVGGTWKWRKLNERVSNRGSTRMKNSARQDERKSIKAHTSPCWRRRAGHDARAFLTVNTSRSNTYTEDWAHTAHNNPLYTHIHTHTIPTSLVIMLYFKTQRLAYKSLPCPVFAETNSIIYYIDNK